MTFGALESSRFSGEPVHLYLFTCGNVVFAYTDAEQAITFVGQNYTPLPIDRGKVSSSGTLDRASLTLNTPHDCPLAELYLTWPPSSVTTLVMRQGHVSDSDGDFKVVFTGRVMSCARKGSQAEFNCEPVSTSMRRNGLRRRYQYGCPHVLYGTDCRASKAAATVNSSVASISGSRVTLPAGWPGVAQAAKYVGGLLEWTAPDGNGEVRTILRSENSGLTFLLSGAPRGLVSGSAVSVVLGCNHKSGTPAQPDGDCGPLHNNVQNFGGQEYIPFKNPIGTFSNQFY